MPVRDRGGKQILGKKYQHCRHHDAGHCFQAWIFLPCKYKNHCMKNMHSKNINKNIHFDKNKHRPENKDDLDSREGLEQQSKGLDVTHNVKENQSERKKIKNK